MNLLVKNIIFISCVVINNTTFSQYFDQIYEKDSSVQFTNTESNVDIELNKVKKDSTNSEFELISYKRNCGDSGNCEVVFYKVYDIKSLKQKKDISIPTNPTVIHRNYYVKSSYSQRPSDRVDNNPYPNDSYYNNQNNATIIYIANQKPNWRQSNNRTKINYKEPKSYSNSYNQQNSYKAKSTKVSRSSNSNFRQKIAKTYQNRSNSNYRNTSNSSQGESSTVNHTRKSTQKSSTQNRRSSSQNTRSSKNIRSTSKNTRSSTQNRRSSSQNTRSSSSNTRSSSQNRRSSN